MATTFETKTCSRCGGGGHYSYCPAYGTKCFKCHGAGKVYTKRGLATKQYYEKLLSVPACDLKVGDRFKAGSITGNGTPYDTWVTVASLEPIADIHAGTRSFTNGVEQPHVAIPGFRVSGTIHNGSVSYGTHLGHDHLVRLFSDGPTKQVAFTKALAYQDTLTKQGVPSKRVKSEAK